MHALKSLLDGIYLTMVLRGAPLADAPHTGTWDLPGRCVKTIGRSLLLLPMNSILIRRDA